MDPHLFLQDIVVPCFCTTSDVLGMNAITVNFVSCKLSCSSRSRFRSGCFVIFMLRRRSAHHAAHLALFGHFPLRLSLTFACRLRSHDLTIISSCLCEFSAAFLPSLILSSVDFRHGLLAAPDGDASFAVDVAHSVAEFLPIGCWHGMLPAAV